MDDYKTVTRSAYDDMAQDYAKRDSEVIEETYVVKAALNSFISRLPVHGKVLDIGSGGGRDSAHMLAEGLNVTGIDFSEHMLKAAKQNAPGGEFLLMDFEELKFETEAFDGVWANASLHHVPKTRLLPVLKRIHEILKPNGLFFSVNKQGEFDGIRTNQKYGKKVSRHFSFYTPDELSQLIKTAGFSIEDISLRNEGEWVHILAKK